MTAAAPWPRAEALTTARLVLEPLRPDHAHELAPVLDDPALHAFTGGEPADEGALRARFARQAVGHARHLGLAATDERRAGEVRWVGS